MQVFFKVPFTNTFRTQKNYSSKKSFYFFYLFSFATRAGSPQQREPITVGPYYQTHPVNFSLWEETGVLAAGMVPV